MGRKKRLRTLIQVKQGQPERMGRKKRLRTLIQVKQGQPERMGRKKRLRISIQVKQGQPERMGRKKRLRTLIQMWARVRTCKIGRNPVGWCQPKRKGKRKEAAHMQAMTHGQSFR